MRRTKTKAFPVPPRPGPPSAVLGELHIGPAAAGMGPQEVGAEKYQAEIPREDGIHLWVLVGMHRVDPIAFLDGRGGSMDSRSLLAFDGPACFWCQQPYSMTVSRRFCKAVD